MKFSSVHVSHETNVSHLGEFSKQIRTLGTQVSLTFAGVEYLTFTRTLTKKVLTRPVSDLLMGEWPIVLLMVVSGETEKLRGFEPLRPTLPSCGSWGKGCCMNHR